jgi:uncharacterized delta-60 repeat protein
VNTETFLKTNRVFTMPRNERRKVVKNIPSKIAVITLAVLVFAGAAMAQPVNDNFANATVLSGLSGSTSGNNLNATMEASEPTPILTDDDGPIDVTNSVWFEWTAPQSGQVEFDTIGSVDDTFNPMDTVLAEWLGTSLTNLVLTNADDNSGDGFANSSNSFLAVAGQTYYIAVYVNADAPGNPGNYVLNWNEQPAPAGGGFNFTAAGYTYSQSDLTAPVWGFESFRLPRATVTRTGSANGAVEVAYYANETLYTNISVTNIYVYMSNSMTVYTNAKPSTTTNITSIVLDTTISYQSYNANHGGYYTRYFQFADTSLQTNFNGTPGPLWISNNIAYVTNPPFIFPNPYTSGPTTNTDGSITTSISTLTLTTNSVTNYVTSYTGQTIPGANLATFLAGDDLVLGSGDLFFQDFEMNQDISLIPGTPLPNDADSYVQITLTNAALDPLEDPTIVAAPTLGTLTNTAVNFLSAAGADFDLGAYGSNGTTNYLYGSLQASTNLIANFERSTIVCNKNVNGAKVAKVYVLLPHGPGNQSITVYYRTDHDTADDDNNIFTTQPGSDYARPDNATAYTASTDFTSQSGSVTFPANMSAPYREEIDIPITQDNQVKFDRDILMQLYWPSGVTPDCLLGNITTCDLTIAYTTEPAGAVDTSYNSDNNAGTSPPYDTNPGFNGEVYATVVQPTDGKAVVGGNFTGYNNDNSSQQNYIARVQTNGQLDATFNTGSGFDEAVEGMALDTNGNIIAVGDFGSFNGNYCPGVVRIMPSGAADSSFNPGDGASGPVLATAIQPDGRILIAGSFTNYNGTNIAYVARLNTDGSLDTSFNPGLGPNGDVASIAIGTNGEVYLAGDFTSVAGNAVKYIACLNSDGSFNSGFNVGAGADTPVNVVLVQTNGQVLIGGNFTTINGLATGPGVARLNTDGSVDPTFNVGSGPNDTVYSMTLQTDGNILVGGRFSIFNQTRRVGIARLLNDGWVDTSFMDTAYNQFAGIPNTYYNPDVNPPNAVYSVAEDTVGGVLIGGSFDTVGGDGGPVYVNNNGLSSVTYGIYARNGTHPRNNFARLIGGTTPGPGNIGLTYSSYTANSSSPSYYVSVLRTNGTLGVVSATFEALPTGSGPGYAGYGVDYTLGSSLATWANSYGQKLPATWMEADGLSGPNNLSTAINFSTSAQYYAGPAITMNIISNNNANGSLDIGITAPLGMNTFFLGGENIPLGVAIGNPLAPLTIIRNNVSPGTFNFSQTYYYVSESAGTLVVTVARTGGTANVVTVNYSTANGTAVAGTDYTAKSGTLTFANGVSSQTFTVPILNGSIARPDRTFYVNLSTPGGGATLGTITNDPVEIINKNISSGFVEFAPGTPNAPAFLMDYGTNENNSPAQISVSRLGGTTGTLSVNVAVTNGSAINGVNFVGFTNTLNWTNGDSSVKAVNVTVLDDNVVTTNLTANLRLFGALWNGAATTNLMGYYTNAVLVITNTDSAGTAEFTAPAYTVNENAGYAIIPVVRTGGSVGTLSVSYTNVDGTATAAANYGKVGGTLVFAPGQVSTNFTVSITNLNSQWVTPLNFDLVLSNAMPTNGLGTPNVAQINIDGSQAYNQPPGGPDGTFNGAFNASVFALALQGDGRLVAGGAFTLADGVTRQRIARLNTDGTLDNTFSSFLTTYGGNDAVRALVYETNGLIVVGGNFTNFNNTTLNHIARLNVNGTLDSSFTPGSGTDNPIYAMAQNYVNGQRRIVIGGAFTRYGAASRNSVAQLLDNGTIDTSFSPASGANATVYAVAVQADGRILIGGDFTAVNGSNINHIARLNLDGSLDGAFNPGLGAGDSVRALAVQLDGRILVGGVFTNFNGNTNASHLVRLNASGSLDTAFVMTNGEANGNVNAISVQPDTRIIVGGDFTTYNGVTRNHITRLNPDGTTDTTINFGSGTDGSVLATTIETDGNIDLGGAFANYDSSPAANIVRVYGGSTSGSGVFQFGSGSYSFDERAGFAFIPVIRTGGTAGPNANGSGNITVTFSTSDGSARANTDHGIVTNYTAVVTNLVFPPGEVIETVEIPIFDDGLITTNLTVNLSLSPATPPAVSSVQTNATLYIVNDDSAISFSAATYQAAQNIPGGVEQISLTRLGSTNYSTSVVFNTTTNGTAIPGQDYMPQTNILVTFAPGVSSANAAVPILNSGQPIFNPTVTLALTNAVGSTLYSPSNATLTIVNANQLAGTLFFSATNYNANSSDGNAYLTVWRTNGFSHVVTVNYYTVSGSAQAGEDFQSQSGTVTFPDGYTNETIAIPLIAQSQVKPPVVFNVVLTNVVTASLASPSNATVTISSSIAGISFNVATNYTPESSGVAVILLQRQFNTNNAVSVFYTTSDGTATNGVNYTGASGTVTFTNGATQAAITIGLINNTNQINDLTFNVGLSNPMGGAQLLAPTNCVVVEQAANAGFSFSTNYNTVLKSAGSATITVVCSNPRVESLNTNGYIAVNYYTVNGTAVAGTDYAATSGTLIFSNGIATNTFTVPINNNSLVTGDKQFSVVLTNATVPGQIGSPGTQTVDIAESNAGLEFSQAIYNVFKNNAYATITVNRTGYTNSTVMVNYIATNGTAINGANFYATNGTLTFSNGVTSQSFQVAIIDNTQVDPNLSVLLQLFSPTPVPGAVLVSPSAAVLNILENGGSYVIPAGAQMVSDPTSSFDYTNGILGSNDAVQVLFAFRDSAGLNVTNLNAILLASNGVVSPVAVPASATNYGPLTVYGHSVSRLFSFTVHGTNSYPVIPTFYLYDNQKYIGTAAFGFTVGTWTTSFTNTNLIVIRDNTNASPYPSAINVSGIGGTLVKATVTLNKFAHTYPKDVDVLVTAPAGTNTLLMVHNGYSYAVTNLVVTFDDAATNYLPNASIITNGVYKPTTNYLGRQFP